MWAVRVPFLLTKLTYQIWQPRRGGGGRRYRIFGSEIKRHIPLLNLRIYIHSCTLVVSKHLDPLLVLLPQSENPPTFSISSPPKWPTPRKIKKKSKKSILIYDHQGNSVTTLKSLKNCSRKKGKEREREREGSALFWFTAAINDCGWLLFPCWPARWILIE